MLLKQIIKPSQLYINYKKLTLFNSTLLPTTTLVNGLLETDDYIKTGIPNSKYNLKLLKNEKSLDITLNRTLNPFINIDPYKAVENDIVSVGASLKSLIGSDHPVLHLVANHFFDVPGKRVRPTIVLLLSRALSITGQSSPSQKRLSEISELIHTASLLHDDVIDSSSTRRGHPTVHSVYGNKLAILGGDFLLARASMALAHLKAPEVILRMSMIIEHLVKGEVMQMASVAHKELEESLRFYIIKSFYKTASLLANSCKSAALLGNHDARVQEIAYDFGTHAGLAFQIVDDILDVQSSSEQMGKPSGIDLKCGLATAPVLFASQEFPELKNMIAAKFKGADDVKNALELIGKSKGIEKSKELAIFHASQAAAALKELPDSEARSCLLSLLDKIINRKK